MVEFNGEEPAKEEVTEETLVSKRLRNENVDVEDLNSLFSSEEE